VSKFHHIIVLALVCLWIGSPAMACLPTPQMTHSEMECCKKMAGDCHMGTGQHPCCNTVSNPPTPIASLQPVSHFHPFFAVVAEIAVVQVRSVFERESGQTYLGLPPPAPPGRNSILRI
jgi:hypothetical protein